MEAKLAKQRHICSEFQERVNEVLVDMQSYTFASLWATVSGPAPHSRRISIPEKSYLDSLELLEAKEKLAKSLESVLALKRTGSGLWDHAVSWVDAAGVTIDSQPDLVVADLKKCATQARKLFAAQFANINSTLEHYDSAQNKSAITEKVLEDVKSFNEQRMTNLESSIVELLKLEYNMGLGSNSATMFQKMADAQRVHADGMEQPLPKSELALEPLLRNVHTIYYLRKFYEAEFSVENLDFWLAVQQFKLLTDNRSRVNESKIIFDTYIAEHGPHQVNLPMKVLKDIVAALKESEIPPNVFDAGATECFNMLKSRFDKFMTTKYGRQLRSRLRDIRPFEQYLGTESKGEHTASAAAARRVAKLRSRGTSVGEKDAALLRSATQTMLTEDVHFELAEKLKLTVKPTAMCRVNQEVWISCHDGTIACWVYDRDKNEFRLTRTLTDSKDPSAATMLIRFGDIVMSVSEEGVIKAWDSIKGKVQAKLGGKNDRYFNSIVKTGEHTFWASSGKIVTSYTYKKKKFTSDLSRDTQRPVTSMLRVANTIWIGDQDGGLARYNSQTMQLIGQRVREQSRAVHIMSTVETTTNSGAFTSLNRFVWVASRDCTICIFSEELALIKRISAGHSLPVTSIAIADTYVATSSEDHYVILWKKSLPSFNQTSFAPPEPISTPRGSRIAAGSDLIIERLPNQHKDSINCMIYADDIDQLWCGSSDVTVSVWKRLLKKGFLGKNRRVVNSASVLDQSPADSITASRAVASYTSPRVTASSSSDELVRNPSSTSPALLNSFRANVTFRVSTEQPPQRSSRSDQSQSIDTPSASQAATTDESADNESGDAS